MSPHPTPSDPDQPTGDDPLFRDYLLALLDAGAAVVQGIKRQAEQQAQPTEEPQPPIDLAEQFERVSRAMRRTILLARQIAKPRSAQTHHRTQARKRIIRAVEDAIQSEAQDPDAARAELLDRLDSPDLDDEIASRPAVEIITDIIRDLGLAHIPGTHPWARRTPRDIETLRLRAAIPTPPTYTPALHPSDLQPRENPNRRAHPPDPATEMREMVALARRLNGS